MGYPYDSATPVTPLDPKQVFDIQSGEARNHFLQQLGAKNCRPPLPRSSHLLIKATGRVLPYDPMFAEQQDLVECCDANGNTDPSAWLPTVQPEISSEDVRNEMEIARLRAVEMGQQMSSGYQQSEGSPVRLENIPKNVMSFGSLDEAPQEQAPLDTEHRRAMPLQMGDNGAMSYDDAFNDEVQQKLKEIESLVGE